MVFKGEQIMNLGFYVEDCGGSPRNQKIYNFLNENVKSLRDGAVFFNNVSFNPVQPKFGMFDATEIWHFTGHLICTSVNNFIRSTNVANKFKTYYLFDMSDKTQANFFNLLQIGRSGRVLVDDPVAEKEFYRITGVKPTFISDYTLEDLKGVLNE